MKLKRHSLVALFLSFLAIVPAWARAADGPDLPVEIKAADPGIRYAGRFDTRDAAGPRAAWSNSAVEVRFHGKAFIAAIRRNYPETHIYLASGSMMNDAWPPNIKALSTLKRFLDSVVEDLGKAGDSKLHRIDFTPQDMKDGLGADWHPNVKTHTKMAAKLADALEKDLGWKRIESADLPAK